METVLWFDVGASIFGDSFGDNRDDTWSHIVEFVALGSRECWVVRFLTARPFHSLRFPLLRTIFQGLVWITMQPSVGAVASFSELAVI